MTEIEKDKITLEYEILMLLQSALMKKFPIVVGIGGGYPVSYVLRVGRFYADYANVSFSFKIVSINLKLITIRWTNFIGFPKISLEQILEQEIPDDFRKFIIWNLDLLSKSEINYEELVEALNN